jgi:tape measure domain-containing protein
MAGERVEYEISLRDLLSQKLQNAENSAKGLDGTMGSLQGTIGKIGVAIAGAFAVDRILSFGKSIIEAGSKVEDATTGLTTLLGDTAQATQVVKNTMEDATKTPFAFEGLLSANQQLIAAGINSERAREDVMNLANAVAASGKGNAEFERMTANLAQISTVGKATAQDIKQFGIAGINIYKVLSEATGQPIEKVKEMEVSYDMLTMALKKAHEEGGIYYNGLENMSKNTSVKISNLGDTIFVSMVDIFQQMKPLTDFVLGGIADGLNSIREYISNLNLKAFAEGLISGFKAFNDFMQPLYQHIKAAFNTIWETVTKVWNALSQFGEEGTSILTGLRDALGFLIDAFVWWYEVMYSFIAGVIDVAHTIWVILEKLGVVWAIGKVFEGVWGVIKLIGQGLAWVYDTIIKPVVEKIFGAYEAVKKFLGITSPGGAAAGGKAATEKTAMELGGEAATKSGSVPGMGKIPSMGAPSTGETKGVSGSKVTTINVSIGKLIEEFKIQTTNIGEGAGKVREMVAQALLSAVNDSQITAGI